MYTLSSFYVRATNDVKTFHVPYLLEEIKRKQKAFFCGQQYFFTFYILFASACAVEPGLYLRCEGSTYPSQCREV